MANRSPTLCVEFLEDDPLGLRLVTQSNWTIECLLCRRDRLSAALSGASTFEWLDAPGVYLLIGPAGKSGDSVPQTDWRLYVGQGDSVAGRLDTHLRNEEKEWFRSIVAFRRQEKNPLNLTDCKFLESRLHELAEGAGRCAMANKNAPQLPSISHAERASMEDFLGKALTVLGALGWDLFEPTAAPPASTEATASATLEPPSVPPNLGSLLDEIRDACTGPALPKAEWYATRSDYRARYVGDVYFRVFVRVKRAKSWFWLELKDVGKTKVKTLTDLNDDVREAIRRAYAKAEQYLRKSPSRGRSIVHR